MLIIGLLLALLIGIGTAISHADAGRITFKLDAPENAKEWVLPGCPVAKDHSQLQNDILCYAWAISRSRDFVYTMKYENGTLDPDRNHNLKYICPLTGKQSGDYGFGFSDCYYPHIVADPRFHDPYWQIEKAFEIFRKRPGAFYGYYHRYKVARFFKWD